MMKGEAKTLGLLLLAIWAFIGNSFLVYRIDVLGEAGFFEEILTILAGITMTYLEYVISVLIMKKKKLSINLN